MTGATKQRAACVAWASTLARGACCEKDTGKGTCPCHPLRRSILVARAIFLLIVLLATQKTMAQENADAPAAPTAPVHDFMTGVRTFSLYTGYNRECAGEPQMGYAGLSAGYFFRDDASINAEFRAYGVDQAGDDAAMFELDLLLRHHVIKQEHWTLFFEVSAGITQATRDVPSAGTHFNFIEEVGVGVTVKLDEKMHLITGFRYWHLSNARIHGDDENPALNGYGGYIGLMWTF